MSRDNNSALPSHLLHSNQWSQAWDWAIAQMPCPAFRCDSRGVVVSYNAAAQRLWGGRPNSHTGRWSGFVALWLPDESPVDAALSPPALAAVGKEVPPTELLVEAVDGQSRRLVFHARPLLDDAGCLAGSLCALTDISERRRLEDQAKATDKDRSLFLSMLGHELRNPLVPIMSAATAMRVLSVDASIARMAHVVERQAKQLSRFIDDLLQAARLDGPEAMPIATRDSDVGEVLDRAVDFAFTSITARAQFLRVETADRSIRLHCDPDRIAQALGNVLLNASHYSAEGADIAMRALVERGLLEVSILDNGIGIEPNRLGEVFEPFKSFAESPDRTKPGAGLGLTIAKNIAEAHGGCIDVQSRGPGSGATVTFALPIVKAV